MPEIRLTVVIPHLNQPESLERCLAALAAQSSGAPPFEVIVVDNGSSEPPAALVERFLFARLEQEATPGPGPARSRGARMARGDVVAFIDSDCVARPGWLSGVVAYLDANPETDVIGGEVLILRRDQDRATAIEAYESIWGYRMKLYVERDHYTATCNMAVRRDVFLKVGDFEGIRMAEDLDWGRRATAMGARIDYVADIRIETPARESFAELRRKWDRHIGHDFAEVATGRDRLRWIARALAVAASPIGEIPRVAGSERVSGLRERLLAFVCMTRLRLYRARRMLGLLFAGDGGALAAGWRKQ